MNHHLALRKWIPLMNQHLVIRNIIPERNRNQNRTQIILVNNEEEFTFLNIRFPMPLPYPKPYIQLKELMTTVRTTSESYDHITDITGNPNQALGYILYHFNIDRISRSIRAYRPYQLDQVYYSTFVEPSQYKSLLNYYNLTRTQLQNALAKERLEIQQKYGRYFVPDDLSDRKSVV